MNTTEYRFEFKIDDSGEWLRTGYICFDKASAIKRFDELIRLSKMEWRLIEWPGVQNVIRNEKGKA